MKHFSERLQTLFLPYFFITIGFIVTYTFLNWFLCIYTQWVTLKELYIDMIFPLIFVSLLVYFFIRPRLHVIQIAPGKDTFGLQFLIGISMIIPTVIAQNYIDKATGTLTEVRSVSEISKLPTSKYYDVASFYIDKKQIGMYKTSEISGKHNQHLNFYVYVALPLLNKAKDTAGYESNYWIGKQYAKQVSSRLSDQEKESAYKSFLKNSEEAFNHTNFSDFNYLERLRASDELDNYKEAVKRGFYTESKDVVIFEAKKEPFEERIGDTFEWIFYSWGIGTFVILIIFLLVKINVSKVKKLNEGTLNTKSDLEDFFRALIPRKTFLMTPILIHSNTFIFILMFFFGYGFLNFKGTDLLTLGANFRPLVLQGEVWRLFTNVFLHGGILHLLMNMFALFFAGLFLEPLLGKWRFLFLYVCSGILASIASFIWYDAIVSVGASGAIFGLYGFFIAAIIYKSFPYQLHSGFLYSLLAYIGINLVMGLMGGIDNAAHIGGLLSGFCYGVLFPVKKGK
jgi:rhomboid protease GluP